MKIGMIGLGKMGLNLAKNLNDHEIEVYGYDIDQTIKGKVEESGIQFISSVDELLHQLEGETKTVWMMLPAGEITETTFTRLLSKLNKGDRIIDGGNAHFEDSKRRGELCGKQGIHFFDVGTSGGIAGARNGACMMVGGNKEAFKEIEYIFRKINVDKGYLYTGPTGSGHYLKMIHNGVEYGMMQAIGEGFNLLHHSEYSYDLEKVATVWNHGSVIRSWLMELMGEAFEKGNIDEIEGIIQSSGEGKWTVEEALRLQVPTPVISQALMVRFMSLDQEKYGEKLVSALRQGFGGHTVIEKRQPIES
ncbi:6-phosphogluconate dehydrogenase [Halolactibacillus miurensis]|uniref:6-phosphogluconate dehydrogenase n=2 Tax=Halolactibacillus miurensis TaxID=306541 RepID=A0A1I6P2V4_9BACI|nr:6-phosphogluconate dehydrogenase [Halolactibacillus miurensis]SFS34410.1 6-phosphogluconate dehydrogenase [Halolactibacillus miurensis]